MRWFAIFAALAAATFSVNGVLAADKKADNKTKSDPPEILVATELFLKADANSDGFLNKKEYKNAVAMLQERVAEMAQAGTLASIGLPKDQAKAKKQADKAAQAPTAGLALATSDGTDTTTPTQPKNTMTLDEFKVYVTTYMDTMAAELRAEEKAATKPPPKPARHAAMRR